MMEPSEAEIQRFERLWQTLVRNGITVAALQAFYANYKYLIMSRDIGTYRMLGPLLADMHDGDILAVAERVRASMVHALQKPVTRSGNANALLHISGYLKKQLHPDAKRELLDAIEKYRLGEIAFDVPAALLIAHFKWFPNVYIERQLFLHPQ